MTLINISDNLIILVSEYCFIPDLLSFTETCHRMKKLLLDDHQNKVYRKFYILLLKLQIVNINSIGGMGSNHVRKMKPPKSETINKMSLQLINQWKLFINTYHNKAQYLFKSIYDDLILKSIYTECSKALKLGSKNAYLQGPMSNCNHTNICLLYQSNVYNPPRFHRELLLHSICTRCSEQCLGSVWICCCCYSSCNTNKCNHSSNNSDIKHTNTDNNNHNSNNNGNNNSNTAATSNNIHHPADSTHSIYYSDHPHSSSSPSLSLTISSKNTIMLNDEVFCSLTCAHQSPSHYRHPFREITCNTNYSIPKKYLCCCLCCGLAGYITLVATTISKGITSSSSSSLVSSVLKSSNYDNNNNNNNNKINNSINSNSTFPSRSSAIKNPISTATAITNGAIISAYEIANKNNHSNDIYTIQKQKQMMINGDGLVHVEFICVCYQSHLRQKLQSEQGRRDIVNQLTERDLLLYSSGSS